MVAWAVVHVVVRIVKPVVACAVAASATGFAGFGLMERIELMFGHRPMLSTPYDNPNPKYTKATNISRDARPPARKSRNGHV